MHKNANLGSAAPLEYRFEVDEGKIRSVRGKNPVSSHLDHVSLVPLALCLRAWILHGIGPHVAPSYCIYDSSDSSAVLPLRI